MKAFIFDFDGLIVDTEIAEFETWKEVYAEQGATLEFNVWTDVVGSAQGYFDPYAHLEGLLGRSIDRKTLGDDRRRCTLERIATMPILPGVEAYIAEGKRRGMRLGVASNSTTDWVVGHLARIGLVDRFDCIRCSNQVKNPKPAPDLYQAVLDEFGIEASEAIAFEDSPHGVHAARTAGIFTVAIPNPLTKGLDFSHASLRIDSLADVSPEQLLTLAREHRVASEAQ